MPVARQDSSKAWCSLTVVYSFYCSHLDSLSSCFFVITVLVLIYQILVMQLCAKTPGERLRINEQVCKHENKAILSMQQTSFAFAEIIPCVLRS